MEKEREKDFSIQYISRKISLTKNRRIKNKMLNDELNWTARHFPREAEGVVQGFIISNQSANLGKSANQSGLFIIRIVFFRMLVNQMLQTVL